MRASFRGYMFGAAVAVVGVLAALPAEAKPIRVPVTAFGSGTDTDRGSAMSAAGDNAKGMLVCAGSLEDVNASSTGCVKLGSDDSPSYTCTAVAKGTCVLP